MTSTDAPCPPASGSLVVGAGFAGLGTAIKLDEDGFADFLVARQGRHASAAPGATTPTPARRATCPASSTPSASRPTPTGRARFSPQPEIHAYLERTAARVRRARPLPLRRHRRGRRLGRGRPRLARSAPSAGTVVADVVVTGSGGLSEPRLPDIEGIDSFAGEIFHSARWNHDYDLTGKRVAVIGTGASSIQIVPRDRRAGRPPRRLPAHRPVGDPAQRPRLHPRGAARPSGSCPVCRRPTAPASTGAARRCVPGLHRRTPGCRRAGPEAGRRRTSQRGISDPALREAVTPDFRIGCKRILISNAYYPALARDDVDLVTDGIAQVTPTGIVTADGTEREIDVIIVATGFHTTDQPIADHIKGRDGRTLADVWRERGMTAYKGTTHRRLPQPVPDRRPQHRPGPLLDGLHHREPDRLHRLGAAAPGRAAARHRRADAGGAGPLERRPAAPDAAHRVEHRAAAPAGTSTSTAATPRCGRARPVTFRGLLSAFDAEQYVVTRRTPPPAPTTAPDTKENAA